MPRGEELYQLLRGRLYRRLPMLALPLGLLDWHDCNGKPGCDGRFFYASVSWLESAAQKNAPDGGSNRCRKGRLACRSYRLPRIPSCPGDR